MKLRPKCVEFSSALNDAKIGLILCILRELEPFKVSKVVQSEKVPPKKQEGLTKVSCHNRQDNRKDHYNLLDHPAIKGNAPSFFIWNSPPH